MRPNTYRILSDAVEEGVRHGLNRAEKLDLIKETNTWLASEVSTAVLNCICEYFTFDDN